MDYELISQALETVTGETATADVVRVLVGQFADLKTLASRRGQADGPDQAAWRDACKHAARHVIDQHAPDGAHEHLISNARTALTHVLAPADLRDLLDPDAPAGAARTIWDLVELDAWQQLQPLTEPVVDHPRSATVHETQAQLLQINLDEVVHGFVEHLRRQARIPAGPLSGVFVHAELDQIGAGVAENRQLLRRQGESLTRIVARLEAHLHQPVVDALAEPLARVRALGVSGLITREEEMRIVVNLATEEVRRPTARGQS